jgi:hypothetical protein
VATGPDGTYRVAAPPGPGYLVVQGPDDDYVLREFAGAGAMYTAQPGRRRMYAHAYHSVDLKADGPDQEINLSVRRGVVIRGRAVGPDGGPARDAWFCSRLMPRAQADGGWKLWLLPGDHSRSLMLDGRFVLHGLDPATAAEVPVYFLDPERKLGAVVRFSGRSAADAAMTVRLEPCGSARARLVTTDGKPLERYAAAGLVSLVVTPGPPIRWSEAKDGPPFAEEAYVGELDTINYVNTLVSDAEGRLTFPALIPGATYRVEDVTAGPGGPVVRKEFIVKSGEQIDLGDVLIAKPREGN